MNDEAGHLAREKELVEQVAQLRAALVEIAIRIQDDRGEWKIRKPHSEMPAVVAQINAAMKATIRKPVPVEAKQCEHGDYFTRCDICCPVIGPKT